MESPALPAEHKTFMEAAKCGMARGAGWYVFAVEGDTPRQLNETEERIVDEFRFGHTPFAVDYFFEWDVSNLLQGLSFDLGRPGEYSSA